MLFEVTKNNKNFSVDQCAFSFWGYDHLVYNVVQQSNVTASIAYLVVDGSGDLVGTEKELFFFLYIESILSHH